MRVESRAADGSGPAYREAAGGDEVLFVRGTSPARVWRITGASAALAVATLGGLGLGLLEVEVISASVAFVASLTAIVHALVLGARALAWSELRLGRDAVEVRSGPFPRAVRIEGWAAREVVVESSVAPGTHLALHHLYAEGDGSRRVLLATLHDLESTQYVLDMLATRYAHARSGEGRDPFARVFGPLPDGVVCRGDPHDPASSWTIEIMARRATVVLDLIALLVTSLFLVGATFGAGSVLFITLTQGSSPAVLVCGPLAALGIWLAIAAGCAGVVRDCVVRLFGRLAVTLDRDGVLAHLAPTGTRWRHAYADVPGARILVLLALGHRSDVTATLAQGARRSELTVPLTREAALYLQQVVEGFQAAHRPPAAGAAR